MAQIPSRQNPCTPPARAMPLQDLGGRRMVVLAARDEQAMADAQGAARCGDGAAGEGEESGPTAALTRERGGFIFGPRCVLAACARVIGRGGAAGKLRLGGVAHGAHPAPLHRPRAAQEGGPAHAHLCRRAGRPQGARRHGGGTGVRGRPRAGALWPGTPAELRPTGATSPQADAGGGAFSQAGTRRPPGAAGERGRWARRTAPSRGAWRRSDAVRPALPRPRRLLAPGLHGLLRRCTSHALQRGRPCSPGCTAGLRVPVHKRPGVPLLQRSPEGPAPAVAGGGRAVPGLPGREKQGPRPRREGGGKEIHSRTPRHAGESGPGLPTPAFPPSPGAGAPSISEPRPPDLSRRCRTSRSERMPCRIWVLLSSSSTSAATAAGPAAAPRSARWMPCTCSDLRAGVVCGGNVNPRALSRS